MREVSQAFDHIAAYLQIKNVFVKLRLRIRSRVKWIMMWSQKRYANSGILAMLPPCPLTFDVQFFPGVSGLLGLPSPLVVGTSRP